MKMTDKNFPEPRLTLSQAFERGHLFAEACPSRDVLRHVTSRWGVLVFIALLSGTHRFSELRRKIGGVSERMLAQTLQWLEADGFVLRVSHPVVPPHVEYSLTPLGREAGEKVQGLADWIEVNLPRIAETWAAPSGAPQADLVAPGPAGQP
jgi:DNA-binding HxlR family transcriptional regulator